MLCARTVLIICFELLKAGINLRIDSVFSYGFLFVCFMENVPFYRKKSFWTLVISIVTALSVYFAASCTRKMVVSRSGIHCDTVRVTVDSHIKLP